VLALVAGICYAAFHLGMRAMERGEAAVTTAQRLRVATDVLIRQVKSASAHPASSEGDTFPYFYGKPTVMSFVTEAGQLSGGGETLVRYHVETDACADLHAGSPCLVLSETPYFDSSVLGGETRSPAEPQSAAILDGFLDLRFEYYDPSESFDCPKDWCSTWNFADADVLPGAVRVLVKGLSGLEEDEWGQEIPVMASTFGEDGGSLDPDNEPQDCEGLTGSDEDGTTGTAGKPGTTKPSGGGGNDDAEDREDEE
jgi:hypothetical protein